MLDFWFISELDENFVKVLDFEIVLVTARLTLSNSSSFLSLIESSVSFELFKEDSLEFTEFYLSIIGLGNSSVTLFTKFAGTWMLVYELERFRFGFFFWILFFVKLSSFYFSELAEESSFSSTSYIMLCRLLGINARVVLPTVLNLWLPISGIPKTEDYLSDPCLFVS